MRGLAMGLFAAACSAAPGASAVETTAMGSSSGAAVDDGETSAGASTSMGGTSDSSTADAGTTDGSSDTSGSETHGTTGSMPVEDAIERGIAGTLALAGDDIVLLLLMDVMHRRFGVEEFAEAAQSYDATLAELAEVPVDALAFRRIFDPTQVLTTEQLDAIAPGVNRVTVPALFCDVLPWPPGYDDLLQENAALSSYELTHVALALRWASELDCTAPLDAAFADAVANDSFALVDTSDGVRDLELEAALFAGKDALPPDLVDATIAAQLADGTWPRDPGDADGNGHTTGLALFLLLELHRRPLDTFVTTHG
jgi:hypothetical protein